MNIVFLDTKTIGEDIDLSGFDKIGTVTKYSFSNEKEIPRRIQNAHVIIVNKIEVNADTIGTAHNLKLVCVTATGTNNLDKDYLDSRGIQWRNVAGYSTDSVAQHTFAMLLYLLEKLRYYDDYVKNEHYVNDTTFTHFDEVFCELRGKTLGIIGLGNIGRQVASIATAFGMEVIYASPSGSAPQDGYTQVDMDTLLRTSDVLSVHAPLTKFTEGLMNAKAFSKMKKSSIFLNLGRGQIVAEKDLADALSIGQIAAAGLDVLSQEPMAYDNPLRDIKDSRRLFITPHVGWASVESRTRLMQRILGQVTDFKKEHNL